ncbi:LptF/LptG family permease [Zavarzinella formosa]|uniref:LptF/LptG family permease n=1 Tax=Zavarzinella formosa TaxID=360055 RepID=UPI00031EE812|nr:LptF/LptG family permease [Zavarzinella formosa]
MIFGTINRMILMELIKVFLMALTGLTGMFMLGGVIQEASQKGLSPGQILVAIPLIIPNTFPYTIPATTLFATCIVYGRMSADSEVLVLRAAGVNIYHLLWPAILLGIATTLVTAGLYYDPIPRSQRILREQLLKDAEQVIYSLLKREGGLRQNNLDFVLYVRDVQGKDLIDVVVKKRKADRTGYELVARAQTARIRVQYVTDVPEGDPDDPESKGTTTRRITNPALRVGGRYELVVVMDRCVVDSLKGDTAADLHYQEYSTALPEAIFGKDTKDRPSSQTWNELFERLDELRVDIADQEAQVQKLEADKEKKHDLSGKTNGEVARDIRIYTISTLNRFVAGVRTEMQMRPALSMGCMCFVLIGCPVGIWASRSDYLSIFMMCFLPTILIYYPILMATLNMAKDGKAQPFLAWTPDVVLAIGSMFLIRRLMKR